MPDLGHSLRKLVDGATSPIDLDGIVAARRRRRWRRRAVAGAALGVVVILAAGGIASRTTSSETKIIDVGEGNRPTEADATRDALNGLRLISPGGGTSALTGVPTTVDVIDAATGRAQAVTFPLPGAQSILYPFLTMGSDVVFVVDTQTEAYDPAIGTAYVASADFERWRALGPASAAVAGAEPGQVFLVTDNVTPDQRLHGTLYGTERKLSDVMVDRSLPAASYPLTDRRFPIAAVDSGLLTSRPGRDSGPPVYEVWDPATNAVVRMLDIAGYEPDVSDRFVAWTAADCRGVRACPVRVTDVVTGTERKFAPPVGMQWAERAFSPDGSRLALLAVTPFSDDEVGRDLPPGYVIGGIRRATIVVLDLTSGNRREWSTAVWKGGLDAQWSPDGSLVFFTRNRGRVGYVNARYAAGLVRDVTVDGAAAFLVLRQPAPTAGAPRYTYDGPVAASPRHSAELCVYPTTATYGSDACAGPPVAGWDPQRPNGQYHLVGTYDGSVLTLTQPPTVSLAPTIPPSEPIRPGCATPPGGWRDTDTAKVSFDTFNAVMNTARSAPDFAGVWIGPHVGAFGVVNFAFTHNADAHRRALSSLYGGPICVVQRPRAYSDLQRISRELLGPLGEQLGLQVITIGPDDAHDVVHAEVIASSVAMQRELDERYGAGTVVVSSVLSPVP